MERCADSGAGCPGRGSHAAPYGKLAARRGASQERVIANQRERILGAVVQIVAERGYSELRVRDVAALAGVSTRTFYEIYDDKQDCFLDAHWMIARRSARNVLAAGAGAESFEQQMRAAFLAFTGQIAHRPRAARFALVEVLAGGEAARTQMRESHAIYEKMLARSFAAAPDAIVVPPRMIEGIVAGVAQVCRAHLLAGRANELSEAAEELVDWALALRCKQAAMVSRLPPAPARSRPAAARAAPGSRDDRQRLMAAAIRLAARDGYRQLSGTGLRAATGVSRAHFEQSFQGARDCLQQAVQERIEEALKSSASVGASAPDWPRGVHRATTEFCALMSADPDFAVAALIELPAAGRESLAPRHEIAAAAARALLTSAPGALAFTEARAHASIAATWAVMRRLVAAGQLRRLPASAATLSFLILAPAVGGERALKAIAAEQLLAPQSRPRPGTARQADRARRQGTGAGAFELSG